MSIQTKKFGGDATNRIMVRLDTDKLEAIERELNKVFVAQIGVLGVKASGRMSTGAVRPWKKGGGHKKGKSKSDLSNVDIGLIHEKGSKSGKIPRRSFLEVPLTTKMPALMSKIGNELLKGLSAGNIQVAYAKLASIAEGVVLRAFNSSGYGTWQANSPSTVARKHSSRPLIDTAQLRQSIASRVITK